jgi:hypothetical protein
VCTPQPERGAFEECDRRRSFCQCAGEIGTTDPQQSRGLRGSDGSGAGNLLDQADLAEVVASV